MDPAFIRTRFEQISRERKISIRWLSQAMGINRYFINKLMRGDIRNGKDVTRLKLLIEKLGYTEESFFEGSGSTMGKGSRGSVPLYGDIPAGNPTWFDGHAQPDAWVEQPPQCAGKKLFALRVRGDSMAPRFKSGDLIYLEPLSIKLGVKDPENPVSRQTFERLNQRVVAAMVDGESTLKELKIVAMGKSKDNYELHLMPMNPEYAPIVIGPKTTAEFQGVVVRLVRDEP